MQKVKCYTGVGSRKTPAWALELMKKMAAKLSADGWVLRSGGADGADSAFEVGAGDRKEIYRAHHCTPEAMAVAAKFHPAWHRCGAFARKLHGRNSFQVLGRDLNAPSAFLVCWTEDGCCRHADRSIRTGGTGTAISIADAHGVEILNLQNPSHAARARRYLKK